MTAVLTFLGKPKKSEILASLKPEIYDELKKASFISFKIAGRDEPVFRNPDVVNRLSATAAVSESDTAFCLVSGTADVIDPTHPPIKGVYGANTSGGNIVSFNAQAFCSYGKNNKVPTLHSAKTASFAYTTALNTLLSKDSKQKLQVGDATTVFWSSRKSAFEDDFGDFFAEPPKDDPDRLTNAVAALYKSIDSGTLAVESGDTRFYVLGLSSNSARISVRFWHCATVQDLALHIRAYFDDLRIVHKKDDKEDLSLWRLLVSTAVQGKSENIAPNLAGRNDAPYPGRFAFSGDAPASRIVAH